MTGEDADEVEQQVRRTVDDMPYLARGWLAVQLRSAGEREEAAWEWKALVPHLKRMPKRAIEWLIATVGHAEVCAWLGDVGDSAPVLTTSYSPTPGCKPLASLTDRTRARSLYRWDGLPCCSAGKRRAVAICTRRCAAARTSVPCPTSH